MEKSDNKKCDLAKQGSFRLDPTIELEKQLGAQIYKALQGDIVTEVLKQISDRSGSDVYWRSIMEGNSLKVEKELLGDIYDLCHEVKEKLGFKEKVDFYITGNSSVNAFSVASKNEDEPNIVNINSGLIDLMTRDELKFVIGHELGHLINKDTALSRLIYFVFPPESNPPAALQYKIRLHQQLAELVADRYGYIATENLGVCVTSFFKLASGLDLAKMNVSIDALIADNSKRLEYFLNDKGMSTSSHPVNPIRVQALNLFESASSQEVLKAGMDKLIAILLKVGDGKEDEYMASFIASAGIIVAGIDETVAKEEYESVVSMLSSLKIFPRQYLDEIYEAGVEKIFEESVNRLLEINPGTRDFMLGYMIDIILADKSISKDEIEFLYTFGEGVGFSKIEVAHAIASSIQKSFVPSLDDIT